MDRVWRGYLIVGGCVLAGYGFTPDGLARDGLYFVVGISATVAVLLGPRLFRPERVVPWWLMAAGLGLWWAGDTLWSWYEDVRGLEPFPSVADIAYLAAYPFLLAGLGRLVGLRQRSRDLPALLDSGIVAIGCGVVSWALLAGPLVRDATAPALERAVGVAYPIGDILVLGVLVRLLTAPGARTPSFKLLLTGAALLPVADTFFLLDPGGTFTAWLDVAWLACYLLWGAAALHPSMPALTRADGRSSLPVTAWRLLALAGAVLTAPVTLAVQTLVGAPPDVWAFVIGATLLFGLVVVRMWITLRIVTEAHAERERLADVLAHAAAHDPLTGLANRARTLELAGAALHRARRSGGIVGLLCVDLDHFKRVNDSYGHRAGDIVLGTVSARMGECVRRGDTVGRLGGDEFVVLVEQAGSEADVVALAERLVAAVGEPVVVDASGATAVVGASVGVSVSVDGAIDAAALLHHADVAAYRAKAGGRGRVEVFDDRLRAETERRGALEAGLRRALAEDGFELHYQPVFDAVDGRVRGYEALLRWRRDDGALVPPAQFLPEVDQVSLTDDIGRWVLFTATRQLARWRADDPAAFGDVTVAVNLAGRHLLGSRLAADVQRALAASGLPPDRLVLEVSEAALVQNPVAAGHLDALRALGVRIAIDEFGAGLTSVGQLANLRADLLKIDRALVGSDSAGHRELVRLLVHAAHLFGLRVVAEGVEDEAVLGPLREAGCDEIQGYLLSRPLLAEDVARQAVPEG